MGPVLSWGGQPWKRRIKLACTAMPGNLLVLVRPAEAEGSGPLASPGLIKPRVPYHISLTPLCHGWPHQASLIYGMAGHVSCALLLPWLSFPGQDRPYPGHEVWSSFGQDRLGRGTQFLWPGSSGPVQPSRCHPRKREPPFPWSSSLPTLWRSDMEEVLYSSLSCSSTNCIHRVGWVLGRNAREAVPPFPKPGICITWQTIGSQELTIIGH